ncbi:hypothetical protein QYM46_16320 [Brevibacterium sp. K11IcPPYGO002]|uniref:hypothetical protein n=1 Tax=Brevibacterium sp. K11IcPPYGO002 TaxID=3058837 RepID=UPI003D818BAE
MGEHVFDGIRLDPVGLTSSTVEEAFRVPDDPRVVARREAHAAETAKQREADSEAKAQAQAEWEAGAAHREAYARFKVAHDNWTAERFRRVRAFETTATMPPEPVFADPATW